VRFLSFFACLSIVSCLIFGQSDHGSIIGIVTDPNARLVQHAEVQATNVETGKQYRAESNDTGQYRITALPVGTYEVSITLPHFEEVRVKDVKAGELQPARVDLILRTK
jgi:hypothetical protein